MKFLSAVKNTLFRRSGRASADKRDKIGGSAPGPRSGAVSMFMPLSPAMAVSTVYRCVEFIAGSVSNLPFQYRRLRDGIFEEDTNSPLSAFLNVQPNPSMNAVDFWKQCVRNVLLKGNAYIIPQYDYVAMTLMGLWIVNSDSVTYDATRDVYIVSDMTTGISGSFGEDEIIHIKNYSTDGRIGISTLEYAKTSISISQTGNTETLDRFITGGRVRGIVSNDTKSVQGFGEYQDKELDKTAENIDDRFRKGESIVSLPGQVQFNPVSLSSTDMQFLESRKFNVPEICRFFGVHPSFVFHDMSSNYKSAETAYAAFLSGTLNPLLRQIELEFLRKMVHRSLWSKREFQFLRRELYTSDLEGRVKYQTATISAGLMTVNEWRKIENKPPVEGGDKVLISANLKPIDELKQEQNGEE